MPKNQPHSLKWAHPIVREWFLETFGAPTEPQIQGWPAILAGKTTLISAPTGSGKTLAAFMACLERLIDEAANGTLQDELQVLYVSPLKALSNDVQKNLLKPLHEMQQLAKTKGIELPEIRVAVRTGDTLARERQAMLKKPPHILVTTPESLYILLTAEKSRALLSTVKTVIIDEIHALADDKRGAHLMLSLERLEAITGSPPIRIGLSATQRPIELVAHYLAGNNRPTPVIVQIDHLKALDIRIEIPDLELGAVASNELWDNFYDRLATLAKENRSTLIFVNTRRLAERIAHHLAERLGEDKVAAHHGSLSRKIRFEAETKLKNGELSALVATASLELGIDIGSVDLVCQIGSPRAISAALQRIGRAGHWHGAVSKGRFFVTTRDELLECAALIRAIHARDLDQLIIPAEPLDILTQQIVATCATGEWLESDLFALVKRAYPYANLSLETFNAILTMLSDGIAGTRGRYSAYLFRDQVNGKIRARRNARLTAITSGGAIPDTGLFTVIAEPAGVLVGTLDEDFAVESLQGDIILLGTSSWVIRRVESKSGRVIVADAHGAPPSVPFWRGEAPGRSNELSMQVSALRDYLSHEPSLSDIQASCGVEEAGALQLIEYIRKGKAVLGAVPTQTQVIAERFFDEGGGMQLVIHAPFGSRINKAWGLALRKKFCRNFNFELQAQATDDGINIALAEQHSFPLADVFHFLHPNTLKETLTQAVLQSPLFKTRWKWDATRSLALVRFRNGHKVPPPIQRMLADDLLAAVFPDAAACQDNLAGKDIELPDHPIINETMKDALHEALDLEGLKQVLTAIEAGTIHCLAVDTPVPSVFSHEILNANPYAFLDDAPLEERRSRAVEMRRVLPDSVLAEVGRLDPAAILEVQQQAWPDVRNADELHDLLQSLISFDPTRLKGTRDITHWPAYFAELQTENRVGLFNNNWYAVEKTASLHAIYTENADNHDAIITTMVQGWLTHLGPVTAIELADLLAVSVADIQLALLKLEGTGFVLRGHFRTYEEEEWCERRLLARIHRLTVGRLRKEIAPASVAQYLRWLLRWQHLTPDTQLQGEKGLLEVMQQLQGFEIPANAWEKQIFAKRVRDYGSDLLDQLCLSGAVGWGRLSPYESSGKRITPTSVAPITFFVREDADWIPTRALDLAPLSANAQAIFTYLQERGASFFIDIVKGVGHLKTEVENGLWELVTAGLITADSFDNLRGLIDPKRRLLQKRRHHRVIRFTAGRWSILRTDPIETHKQIEATCWMLLKRYGVVFRDILQREKNLPRWRELLIAFRRLEDRGEIRGGGFVSGFLGEQFALPFVVESLRASKKLYPASEMVTLAATDPLNLLGIILPGEKQAAFSGKSVTFELPVNPEEV